MDMEIWGEETNLSMNSTGREREGARAGCIRGLSLEDRAYPCILGRGAFPFIILSEE